MCKKQTSVSHSSTESENQIVGCWFAYVRFTCAWLMGFGYFGCWEWPKEHPKPTQACTRETGAETQNTPKIKQVLDQNVDLSNVDQVPSNAHVFEEESQLYIFEDNEAVIKMTIKGSSPTMRHVSRTHRVALDRLLDRINLDPKVQIKYVESKNQLADILTKDSLTRDEWHNLLRLFLIMNDTTFSCCHFSNSHSFLSAGKQSEMSKRSQESSSLGSPTANAKARCLVSRQCVSVGQDYPSNPKKVGRVQETLKCGPGKKEMKNFGWYSVQHASGKREYGSEGSGSLAETHASGNREYTRRVVQNKSQLRHDESISEISINSEKMHISIWMRFMASSMQVCSELREWWLKEIQKLRMYSPQTLRVHFGKNPYCRKSNKVDTKQECTSTRTPCYASENSTVQKMQ